LTAYVLFHSTQAAARAEATLRREGMAVRLVPVPRHLSSECGTALAFDDDNASVALVESRLAAAAVPFAAIHRLADQTCAH